MQILYLSGLASKAAIDDAHRSNPKFSSYAVQKFNRLVTEGFVRNGHSVVALSSFYLPGFGCGYYRRKEEDNGVQYRYIPSPNIRILRHVWLIVYCFFRVLFWGLFNKKEKALVADVLNISACIGAIAAANLIGLSRVGIVTDMPGMRVNRTKNSIDTNDSRISFNTRMNKGFLGHFTHYVFLTEQMNEVINVNNSPYIVMEGLVDVDTKLECHHKKNDKRIMIYAGGLHERYGLRLLVEGFIQADVENSELWLYGSGPFVEELPVYNHRDSRVIYKGIRPNEEVVAAEMEATLLVNPRPTHEAFTKYSFPSKNMEFMVSGTPLLTTKLPGMPVEYHKFVYLFETETTDGYSYAIRKTLTLPLEELHTVGMEAREWVLDNKNNVIQTARIIELINRK